MTQHDSSPHPAREPETTAGLVRAAIFRELDRALDEVRIGLAVAARERRGERLASRRELERS